MMKRCLLMTLPPSNLLKEHLIAVLDDLPPREVRILQLRYGLLMETYTLEVVVI